MSALVVRPATEEDAVRISEIYADYVRTATATFEEEPPSPATFLERMASRPRLPWLVAESDGVVVGYAYGSRHRDRASYRWSADSSVYLAESHRGGGVGRRLYDQLLPIVRSLGYIRVHAGIALPNPASVALHESMGFTLVGIYPDVGYKLGAWLDVAWWSLQLADPPAKPEEPGEWDPGEFAGG